MLNPRAPQLASVCAALFVAFSAPVAESQTWDSRLQDGRSIQVDPHTNKALVLSKEGVATPLWDGVHRLADGSTVTVRSGVMVPNREVLQLRDTPRRESGVAATRQEATPCRLLVRKVCGLNDECADRAVCGPAKQLLRMREQATQTAANYTHATERLLIITQCEDALRDEEFFEPCGAQVKPKTRTACERLRNKVCGADNQCSDGTPCGPARQLLDFETQERYAAADPDTPTLSSGQCIEALRDEEFFAPCER